MVLENVELVPLLQGGGVFGLVIWGLKYFTTAQVEAIKRHKQTTVDCEKELAQEKLVSAAWRLSFENVSSPLRTILVTINGQIPEAIRAQAEHSLIPVRPETIESEDNED